MPNDNGLMFDLNNKINNEQIEKIAEQLDTPAMDMPTSQVQDVDIQDEGFTSVEAPPTIKLTPEQQCEAVFQNYLTTHPNLFLSGEQKRYLKRAILRDCKKGKYNHIFNN